MKVIVSDVQGLLNENEFTREQLEDAIRFALTELVHPDNGAELYISEHRITVEIEN